MRIGQGYDVHRLTPGRKLILGGVEIGYEYGLLGHSDADVLTHAVMDALLGAAGMDDIGTHFPDTDERYKGADSIELLKKALAAETETVRLYLALMAIAPTTHIPKILELNTDETDHQAIVADLLLEALGTPGDQEALVPGVE